MTGTAKKVFASSVAKSMERYRKAALSAVSILDGFVAVGMEQFGARDAGSREVCVSKVRECDIFLGIVGPRYGACPPGETKSFSRIEWETAGEASMSRLMMISNDDFPLPANLQQDSEAIDRQREFRSLIKQDRVVAIFKETSQVEKWTLAALANLHRNPTTAYEGRRITDRVDEARTTVLAFPFVTNLADFDTGIVVSNLSGTPFAPRSHSGSCSLYYYPSHGCRVSPPPVIIQNVAAGDQITFLLSSGNFADDVLPAPEFQGSLIAVCEFAPAAGVATITDGFSHVPQLASSYESRSVMYC